MTATSATLSVFFLSSRRPSPARDDILHTRSTMTKASVMTVPRDERVFTYDPFTTPRFGTRELVATCIKNDALHPLFASLSAIEGPLKVITVTGDVVGPTLDLYRLLAKTAMCPAHRDQYQISLPAVEFIPGDPRLFGLLFRQTDRGALLLLLAPEWAAASVRAAYQSAFNLVYVTSAAVVNWDLYNRFLVAVDVTTAFDMEAALAEGNVGPDTWAKNTAGEVNEEEEEYGDSDDDGSETDTESSASDEDASSDSESLADSATGMSDDMEDAAPLLVPPKLSVVFPNFDLGAPATNVARDVQRVFREFLPTAYGQNTFPVFSGAQGYVVRSGDNQAKRDTDLSSAVESILTTAQPARIQIPDTTLGQSAAVMSGQDYATLLRLTMAAAEDQARLGIQSSSILAHLADEQARSLLDAAIDAYKEAMKEVNGHEIFYDRTALIAKHTETAKKAYTAFRRALDDVPGVHGASLETWTLTLATRLRTEFALIASAVDIEAAKYNRHIAAKEWDHLIASIDTEAYLGTGLKAAQLIADLVVSWETNYRRRAKGPTAKRVLMTYLRGKSTWIESIVNLAKLQAEIAAEDLAQLHELADVVRERDLVRMLLATELVEALQLQVQAETAMLVDELTSELHESASAAISTVQNHFASQLSNLDRQLYNAVDEATMATRQSVHATHNIAAAQRAHIVGAAETIAQTEATAAAAAKTLKEKEEYDLIGTIFQGIIAGASLIGGLTLVFMTGGAAAIIGGVLLSAGISTITKVVMGGGRMSWANFGKSYGIGAITGLISAGVAAGASVAAQAACEGVATLGGSAQSIAQAATKVGISSASSCMSKMIDNGISGKRWNADLVDAAVFGAVWAGLKEGKLLPKFLLPEQAPTPSLEAADMSGAVGTFKKKAAKFGTDTLTGSTRALARLAWKRCQRLRRLSRSRRAPKCAINGFLSTMR
ncbi:hypothetical protein AMAG_12931 [Allomyces macrogynus ATCC 38327]|uniref:Uncharacterized protein n=1 Tax=Allomyces macrogynus (strain ATCC 38327) TaxID=578462 RepID=A0A0L0T0H7_ALLM3|nr:hypothetical protein AMAG_12931 [Allomyces macrogynus ATCC 38327]|eukprot:KNE68257.1 hypothetical protein AMAG_12931 [Allomyces macrogynus ATCC 38327]